MVIAFAFSEEPPGNRYYWLLVEHRDAEVCYSDPGGEPDLYVEAESMAFVDWHRGARSWTEVRRAGSVTVTGPERLARSIGTWNLHAPTAVRG